MTISERIRVLIVDDSALMRKLVADLLHAPEIEIVGTARDGVEALELAAKLRPDVITLDVEMPIMSGLEALPLLLATHKVPVVMLSALTQEGAEVTLAALELGAVDFFPKPDRHQISQLKASRDLLVAKVVAAAQSRVKTRGAMHRSPSHGANTLPTSAPSPPPRVPTTSPACLVIGISTGGPQALSQVLPELKPPMPPILIVQHMPANFTFAFAERLGRQCAVAVKEACDGDAIVPDQILIAPGGRHMAIRGTSSRARITISDGPLMTGHRPSVDMLFLSAAKAFGGSATGIIMTGMGRDGVEGCKAILAAGGATFGQDEATSVVYGMNKAAFLEGALQSQFALGDLPALIERLSRSRG